MSKKQIDIYRTGIYLRLSQGDEDIDGLEKKESNSISNQKLLLEGFIGANDDLKLVDIFIDDSLSNVLKCQSSGLPALLFHTEKTVDFPMFKVFSLNKDEIIDSYLFMKKYA